MEFTSANSNSANHYIEYFESGDKAEDHLLHVTCCKASTSVKCVDLRFKKLFGDDCFRYIFTLFAIEPTVTDKKKKQCHLYSLSSSTHQSPLTSSALLVSSPRKVRAHRITSDGRWRPTGLGEGDWQRLRG